MAYPFKLVFVILQIPTKLTVAYRKSTIRPFVFLNLPAELRLTIYGYLLKSLKPLDKHPRADCDLVEMTDDGHFLGDPYMSLLSRNILSTCHQIYLEGQQFFHENHSFGFHVYLRSPDFVTGALAAPAALPIPIKPQMLKSLHLLIAMDQPSNSFLTADWSILKSMTSLRRLDVALRMTHKCQYLSWHNCQMHTPDSEQMKQSLLIRGMVVEILMLVSATVDLNWTEWNERDNLPRGYRTATQLVESSTLQVLADQFAPLRGLESGSSTPRSKSTV